MLKKACFVVAAAIGVSLIAAPFASASPSDDPGLPGLAEEGMYPTFCDAYLTLILGGDALGDGAGALMADVYTSIATHSFGD